MRVLLLLLIVGICQIATATPPPDAKKRVDCPDLIITDAHIISHKKKVLEIEYTIKNVGSEPAYLEGLKKKKLDNISIYCFLSGDRHLDSGGDILTDAFYLNKISNEGVLQPADTYTGKAKIHIPKQTSFNSVLILYIDPQELMQECDETNNTFSLQIE